MTSLRASIILLPLLAGCTGLPERMSTVDAPMSNCGYSASAQTDRGLALEIAYHRYSFYPIAEDAALLEGRECFTRTAAMLAAKAGRQAEPMNAADMASMVTRNMMDGRYSVRVTGKVVFRPPQ